MKQKVDFLLDSRLGMEGSSRTKFWAKRLIFVAAGCFAISMFLYLILALTSNRNVMLNHYSKQMKSWKKTNASGMVSEIGVGLSIIPSSNTMGNLEVLAHETISRIKNKKINKKYAYDQSYFYMNDTTNYFTTLRVDEKHVPFGDSRDFCFHFVSFPADMSPDIAVHEHIPLSGMPTCENSENPRARWRRDDPTIGVPIKTWQQHDTILNCKTKDACRKKCEKKGGIYSKSKKTGNHCYTYQVLQEICILIDKDEGDNWNFAGGCYKNGAVEVMTNAIPGKMYDFTEIPIQVRHRLDPYALVVRDTGTEDVDFGIDIDWLDDIAFFLFLVTLFLGIVIGLAYVFHPQFEPHVEKFEEKLNSNKDSGDTTQKRPPRTQTHVAQFEDETIHRGPGQHYSGGDETQMRKPGGQYNEDKTQQRKPNQAQYEPTQKIGPQQFCQSQ
eukprot:TRINITY_DN15265_c0_g1_i1.p1 TRINITY_DN15265_c0_g1~~TRINITY_DN15265_c0_g1_i1.p1  ORF type:complete len:441 (-),score=48.89 TRINITY_DN15265_c0_g1_i1:35-1357(-)